MLVGWLPCWERSSHLSLNVCYYFWCLLYYHLVPTAVCACALGSLMVPFVGNICTICTNLYHWLRYMYGCKW